MKKTWVDIPDLGQKAVIQDGVQDGRRTLISNITPSGSVLEWWIWWLYLRFWGQGIQWTHFLSEKVAGNGEFANYIKFITPYSIYGISLWGVMFKKTQLVLFLTDLWRTKISGLISLLQSFPKMKTYWVGVTPILENFRPKLTIVTPISPPQEVSGANSNTERQGFYGATLF